MSTVSRRQFLYSLGVVGVGAGLGLAGFAESGKLSELTKTRLMMGTFVTITVRNESRTLLDEAIEQAFTEIAQAEVLFTRHNSSSPLGVLNEQGVLRDAPGPVVSLLEESLRLARRTQGGFNPATSPVLAALAAHGATSVAALPVTVLADLKAFSDPNGIIVQGNTVRLEKSGMGVSLDGIAKGHIVDLAAASLEGRGVTDYLVNAGGDIRVGPDAATGQGWMVGIQDGAKPAENITTVRLRSGAIATSGNYESLASKGYRHLVSTVGDELSIDASVSVVAPSCTEADSLATALYAMGVEKGTEYINRQPGYACLWQTKNGLVSSLNWSNILS